ncbi:hypothetical protein FF80_03343 [Devosia sp. LC5]|uniref:hypothetical protein n=1 Tax=Devosia sp. LC5 TaxID=1502724 RepID=UPI0004E4532C|nr:hypothetical protein [Devosia sp. LC5]KFC62776.1 hypothetical protein FF80_03343 [Devosia sp. LC5]
MKLKLQVVGHHLMLCDESGEPLPNQTRIDISDRIDDLPRLTVEFIIDGENITPAESEDAN